MQLLDFKFNPVTFEQDFNVWETIKTRYERQSGQLLPDGVLVATLLDKTTGALQQHLRLNARTLQTYAQVREVILEYHRSRLLMNPVPQTSANAAFQGGASAPMDIGALAAALWKGKGKGKKGKGKGKGKGQGQGKGKGKGKGQGKDFPKSSGKGNQHWNFMKGKGKGKGKGKPTSSSTSVCWSCGKTGYFASNCPNYRVGIRPGMIHFGLGTLGPGMLLGIRGVGLRTLLRTFGLRLLRPLLRRRPKLWRSLRKRLLLLRVVRQLCPCQL